MSYDILEIKKYDKKILNSTNKAIQYSKIIGLCAIIVFIGKEEIFNKDINNVLLIGSVSGGTLSVISLVKSICNIYLCNEKRKELKNDRCK